MDPVLFLIFFQTKKLLGNSPFPASQDTPDCIPDLAFRRSPEGTISRRIHGLPGIFYLHENHQKSTIHVGKYTRLYMDPVGMKTSDLVPFHLLFITCKITSH